MRESGKVSTNYAKPRGKCAKDLFGQFFLVLFDVSEGDTDDIDYILEVLVREVGSHKVEIY